MSLAISETEKEREPCV